MNKKSLLSAFLAAALIAAFALVGSVHFGTVQASTDVFGIIGSDTTWTKTNSLYALTGNVLVNNGVTLAIESGVSVNLNGYYIMVNGTLRAQGTGADRISFNGAGSISFTQSSTSWNEQTGSGSIIENANLDSAQIGMSAVSPKINSNTVMSISVGGSAVISNNNIINGININSDSESPKISGNTISGEFKVSHRLGSPVISYNTINNGIAVGGDAAGSVTISYNTISGEVRTAGVYTVISHNTINGEVSISGSSSSGGSAIVSDNTITGGEIGVNCAGGLASDTTALVLNNKIVAGDVGVNLSPSLTTSLYGGRSNATIIGNTISGSKTAGIKVGEDEVQAGHTAHGNIAVIEKNTISNNYYGIKSLAKASIEGNLITNNYYGISGGNLIRYNTISDNSYGILGGAEVLIYNNIQSNSKYSVHLGSAELGFYRTIDLNATYNWWGTTDTSTIKQSIFDFEHDFNLGKVNFVPFLTEPNPQATPDTFVSTPVATPAPSPSPSPSPNPSPSPSQNSTTTPDQANTQNTPQTGLNGTEIAILTVLIVIAALLTVIVALVLRKKR